MTPLKHFFFITTTIKFEPKISCKLSVLDSYLSFIMILFLPFFSSFKMLNNITERERENDIDKYDFCYRKSIAGEATDYPCSGVISTFISSYTIFLRKGMLLQSKVKKRKSSNSKDIYFISFFNEKTRDSNM